MKIVFNPVDEIKRVQKKYPTLASMQKHSAELIAEYGKPYYDLLLQEVVRVRQAIGNNRVLVETKLNYLQAKYEKGKRYVFVATDKVDDDGNQVVKDSFGYEHTLVSKTWYSAGDNVKCTVSGFSAVSGEKLAKCNLVLVSPKPFKQEEPVRYIKSPEIWHGEVQDLGKHRCGKPFRCSCCGRDFPSNAGWRVDLKEIYFCNVCAKQIYEPKGRGNRHFIISTPMGNKR